MALVLDDRVRETTQVTGTGSATLLGAVTGYQSFSVIGNGNTTYYTIADQGGPNWEVGIGTYSSGTLARTTVLSSSNSGSLVNFTTGTKDVFVTQPSEKAVYLDSINTATVPQLATSSFTSTTPVLSFNASNSPFASGASVSGSYLQTILQNKSTTAGASTNYVLSNDLGTDSSYYGEFGMNSSVFSASTPTDFYSINNGIYFSGHDGDISVGSGNGYKLYFPWGSTGQSAHVINASGALGFSTNLSSTPATSGTTGFGTTGQVLSSNGNASAPTWVNASSLATAAGGSNTQVQYNSSGSLAGSANMTFNGTSLTLANDASISGLTVGKGGGALTSNTVFGLNALAANTTGSDNVAIGTSSAQSNTTGSQNTYVGGASGFTNTVGTYNAGFGKSALYYNTGSYNSGIGGWALLSNTSGSNNTASGYAALFSNTTASNNTAVGYQAGYSTTTQSQNCFFGYQTGYANTTGYNAAFGDRALTANTTASYNAAFGQTSLLSNTTGGNNTAVGTGSLQSNTTASNNTAVGYQAGYSNTTGVNNVYIGNSAGYYQTSNGNTAIGVNAMLGSTGSSGTENTAVGIGAMQSVTSGNYNTALGHYSMLGNNTGSYNAGLGHDTLYNNTTGSYNAAGGMYALFNNTTASNNTAFGYQAGYSNTTGTYQVLVGYQAGYSNTVNSPNTFVGFQTGYYQTGTNVAMGYRALFGSSGTSTGNFNTSIGDQSLYSNTTASNNTAVGYQAGYTGTTATNLALFGYQAGYNNTANDTTAFGYASALANTSGTANTALGSIALRFNTTGSYNVAVGKEALQANTTASNNTAVGYQAGYSNTNQPQNTLIGYLAGYASTGGYNTFVGGQAGQAVTSGVENTFIGQGCGQSITTGSYNVIIGNYSGNAGGLDIRTANNYIVLSDGDGNPRGIFDGSGKFLIGMTSYSGYANGVALYSDANGAVLNLGHTTGSVSGSGYILFGYNNGGIGSITQNGTTAVAYNTTSDYRLKNDVAPIQNALATVEALNPVSFTWVDGRKDDGFLAHEIQAVIPNCVTGEKDAVNKDGTPKYQQMDNSGVIPFLVAAIKELNAKVTELEAKLAAK